LNFCVVDIAGITTCFKGSFANQIKTFYLCIVSETIFSIINEAENYRAIAEKIRDNTCVLFLGPGAVMAKDSSGNWCPLSELCAKALAQKYELKLNPEEGYTLSYVTSLIKVQKALQDFIIQEDVARFYRDNMGKVELHPLLDILGNLQFRIVINTTPDNTITQIFDGLGRDYKAFFYNFSGTNPPFTFDFDKNPRTTVVYNLFGRYDQSASLPLSNRQQVDYIRKIVSEQQNDKIPDVLTNAFRRFRCHLFLGFDFEDWNLRLLLDTLYKNIRDDVQPFAFPSDAKKGGRTTTQIFFFGEFKMQFARTNLDVFVEKIKEQYENFNAGAATSSAAKATILILHHEAADEAAFQLLSKQFALKFNVRSVKDAVGQGDVAAWVRQQLDSCDIVMPLLSADLVKDPALGMDLLDELVAKHKPKQLFVVPVSWTAISGLEDTDIGQMATLRPSETGVVLSDPARQAELLQEIVQYIDRYVSKSLNK
jgi:SIR2-like domain